MRLFQQAGFPKSFVSVDGADHLLAENDGDWQFVARRIESWSAYLSLGSMDEKAGRRSGERGRWW